MSCTADEFIEILNKLNSIEVFTHDSPQEIINDTINITNELKKQEKQVFYNYFNDPAIPNSEGFNRNKVDGIIGYFHEYNFRLVRDLVFKYLNKYNKFLLDIDLNSLYTECSKMQDEYEKFEKNNTKSSSDDDSSQKEDPLELFWKSHLNEFESILSPAKSIVNGKKVRAENAANVILNWINFGLDVMHKISDAQSFVSYKDEEMLGTTEFKVYNNNLSTIQQIAPSVAENFAIAQSVSDKKYSFGDFQEIKMKIIKDTKFRSNCTNYINTIKEYFIDLYGEI